MLKIPRRHALALVSADTTRASSTTKQRRAPSAAPLGPRRYLFACFGIVTAAAGVTLTVSALALMAVERPVAEASNDIPPVSVVYFEHVGEVTKAAPEEAAATLAGLALLEAGGLYEEASRLVLPAAAEAAVASSLASGERPPAPAPHALLLPDSSERHLEGVTAADSRILDPDHTQTLHALGLPSLTAGLEAPDEPAPPEAATIEEQPPAAPVPTEDAAALAAFTALEAPLPAPPAAVIGPDVHRVFPGITVLRSIARVNVTFYDCAEQGFCGNMANGRKVYQGAAACSYDLPFGTRFFIEGDPTGRIYRCEDRGLLSNTWVDIFWYFPADGWRWQEVVGRLATIHIIEWGSADD
jgi:hypothetical protein